MKSARYKGPWSPEQASTFLDAFDAPAQIACNGSSGHPVLVSLWFAPIDESLWLATRRSASVVTHLERDPRCAFEVSDQTPPYRGIRGQGSASLHPDRGEEILNTLIQRYLGSSESRLAQMLLAHVATEVAIELRPDAIVSWDYRERMADSQ